MMPAFPPRSGGSVLLLEDQGSLLSLAGFGEFKEALTP